MNSAFKTNPITKQHAVIECPVISSDKTHSARNFSFITRLGVKLRDAGFTVTRDKNTYPKGIANLDDSFSSASPIEVERLSLWVGTHEFSRLIEVLTEISCNLDSMDRGELCHAIENVDAHADFYKEVGYPLFVNDEPLIIKDLFTTTAPSNSKESAFEETHLFD